MSNTAEQGCSIIFLCFFCSSNILLLFFFYASIVRGVKIEACDVTELFGTWMTHARNESLFRPSGPIRYYAFISLADETDCFATLSRLPRQGTATNLGNDGRNWKEISSVCNPCLAVSSDVTRTVSAWILCTAGSIMRGTEACSLLYGTFELKHLMQLLFPTGLGAIWTKASRSFHQRLLPVYM